MAINDAELLAGVKGHGVLSYFHLGPANNSDENVQKKKQGSIRLNPLAFTPPGSALPITPQTARNRPQNLTSITLSFTHAIETHQTAVDRARSQYYDGLKIPHGPHKKK